MSKFLMKSGELNVMETKVERTLGTDRMETLLSVKTGHSLLCGCGAGGNCASSCVSGCADRG